MNPTEEDTHAALELSADEAAVLAEMRVLASHDASRRDFMLASAVGGLGMFATNLLAKEASLAGMPLSADAVTAPTDLPQNVVKVALHINGTPHALALDSRVVLLDALRERLGLTGSKKGCDQGQCGACTVLVDGERKLACLTLLATLEGREVTTVEGLADGDRLHPVQAAFIKHDGFQCGYCTPGQICSAVGVLAEARRGDVSHVTSSVERPLHRLSDDEIRERMSGNICRCGAYPGIVAAVQEVHSGREAARTWQFATDTQLAAIRREDTDATV